MFQPNAHCILRRRSAEPDRRGEFSYAAGVRTPCAVVKLDLTTQKTSVRADSSGSRGKAEEEAGEAVILFPTYVSLGERDIIEIEGESVEISAIFPRRNVLGALDHIEVTATKAQLP